MAEDIVEEIATALAEHGWDDFSAYCICGAVPPDMSTHQAAAIEQIVRRERAAALRSHAEHIDGGTPRAWDFHHPCDPPGVRWEPTEEQKVMMFISDGMRETADRIEAAA